MPLSRVQLMNPPGAPATTIGAVKSGAGVTISPDGGIVISEIVNSMISLTAGIESTKASYLVSNAVGAVTRNLNAALRDTVSIKDFGAGAGKTAAENDVAITAAVSALNSGSVGSLYIPSGIYLVSQTFTITRSFFSIYGDGPRCSILAPVNNQNVLILSTINPADPNPELARLNDFSLLNFGIDYGNSVGTRRGCAVTLVRPGRGFVNNLDMRGCYRGMTFTGAFSILMSNVNIGGFNDPIAIQTGSYAIKFSAYPGVGVSGNNTEIFISNFNFLSTGIVGLMGENCIIVNAGDGIWFNNGHCGFVEKNDILIDTDANSFVTDIYFQDIYCDGHLTTTTDTTGAILIKGSNTSLCGGLYFRSCTIRNHYNKPGIEVSGRESINLSVIDCQFVDNGRGGILAQGSAGKLMSGTQIINNYFNNNNIANVTNNSVVSLDFADMSTVANNTIISGVNPSTNGTLIKSNCKNSYIGTNIVKNCTNALTDGGVNTLKDTQLTAT